MIVVDANLLIYSYNSASAHHKKSAAWLANTLSSAEVVGLPWQSILVFLRVVTNPRLSGMRATVQQAAEVVDEWLRLPNVQILTATERHWSVLRRMLVEGSASGPLATDAEIAAVTIEYGGVLYTVDRDFARFPGLQWKNPLV